MPRYFEMGPPHRDRALLCNSRAATLADCVKRPARYHHFLPVLYPGHCTVLVFQDTLGSMSENTAPESASAQASSPVKRKKAWLWAGIATAVASLLSACQSPPTSTAPSSTAVQSYRKVAAQHLYARNTDRVYKGMLPPMLYAIGVLQVQLDTQGRIKNLHWMRKPNHAPEVVSEIERTVRAAGPFPATGNSGTLTYTETWLWDKSGKFQLDTLSEGQLGE